MSSKSDDELKEIVRNKDGYVKDALIAAIEELENREIEDEIAIILKQKIQLEAKTAEDISQELQKAKGEKAKKKVDIKKTIKETFELLKPSKYYFYTPIILYLNTIIFVLMCLTGVDIFQPSIESLIDWGGNLRSLTLENQEWRLLTNIFLHGGLPHLLFNMYALLYIGGLLERKFGGNRYVFTYIATGIFASIASIAFNENIVSVGASGAIFGMYGIFLSLLISKGLDIPKESRNNLISSILVFIGYNILYGFNREGIDNAAHIGGLISGFIIGFIYHTSLKKPEYSKFVSLGISCFLLATIFICPKIIPNKIGEFHNKMSEFSINEEKALWMYKEDLTYIPPEKVQYYYDKLKIDGVDLWKKNLILLNSMDDMPYFIQGQINLFKEYCELRIQACETMRRILLNDDPSDQKQIEQINIKIEKIINDIKLLMNN